MTYFKHMSPESQGIDSAGITRFLERVEKKGLELHRFMMIRHGICVAKGCYDPYKEDDCHPVYAFTKSFTSTAIGFAVQEGLLSLDDRLVDFFPEEIPSKDELLMADGSLPKASYPSESAAVTLEDMLDNLHNIRIHHLLCMSCGHEEEIQDRGESWIHSFFCQPVLYQPGTFFKYNTAGTNMLAAILKKKTGQDVTEFLKERLFKPLAMGDIFCYHLPDAMQVQAGGSGMKLTLLNMAKFSYFMLQDGRWEGRDILPGWYSLMSKKHMETAGDSEGHIKDWAHGYGYQCWMGSRPGSFRADGAFGQFGLVFPDLDLLVIMNAATEQTQTLLDAVNECLLPAVDSPDLAPEGSRDLVIRQHTLTSRLSHLRLPALRNCHNPVLENELKDCIFEAQGPCSSLKILIGGAGLMPMEDDMSTRAMAFMVEEDRLIWRVKEVREKGRDTEPGIEPGLNKYMDNTTEKDQEKDIVWHEIRAGLCHDFSRAYSQATESVYAASARWRSIHCLELEVRRMDAMSGTRFLFRFEGDLLRIEADESLITDGGLGMTDRVLSAFAKAKTKRAKRYNINTLIHRI